ncbi:MAG: hypothetical protein AB8B87_12025 [Granulosicoccus sp.]
MTPGPSRSIHGVAGQMAQELAHKRAQVLKLREALLGQVLEAYARQPEQGRLMVGIAGAPASGKSTLAEWLVGCINDDLPADKPAVVVPMDGFHLDNDILDARGIRAVKGAPPTFDADGFKSLLQRLSAPVSETDPHPGSIEDKTLSGSIYIPLFDRKMDLARCAAVAVEARHRIVVVEGNYLLLDRPVWRDLAQWFDLTVSLDVPLATLEERLIKRWLDHGFDREAATERALSNDIPNARVVTAESVSAHFVLEGVR